MAEIPEFLKAFDTSKSENIKPKAEEVVKKEEPKENMVQEQDPEVKELEPKAEERIDKRDVIDLKLTDLVNYRNQPFREYSDAEMENLKESIRRIGLQNPIVVRKKDNGKYEILSGHNRKRAFEELGYETIPARIVEADDDLAELIMIDTNIVQRTELTPMERAKAYKIKADIRKAKKWDIDDEKIALSDEEADAVKNEEEAAKTTYYRYLSLNDLIPEFQNKCNDNSLSVYAGEQLSKISKENQKKIFNEIGNTNISLSKAVKLKELSDEKGNNLTSQDLKEELTGNKNILKPSVHFTRKEMEEFFPEGQFKSNDEMKEFILSALRKSKLSTFKARN